MLSTSQRTTLAAHIRANTDPDVVDALARRADAEMAQLYNQPSSFWAWRSKIPVKEYREALDWTEIDNLTGGKARVWEWVTASMSIPLESGSSNVRAGLSQVFTNGSNTRASLLAIAKRQATVAESVFATGTGTEGNPGDFVFEGKITAEDVGRALNDNVV